MLFKCYSPRHCLKLVWIFWIRIRLLIRRKGLIVDLSLDVGVFVLMYLFSFNLNSKTLMNPYFRTQNDAGWKYLTKILKASTHQLNPQETLHVWLMSCIHTQFKGLNDLSMQSLESGCLKQTPDLNDHNRVSLRSFSTSTYSTWFRFRFTIAC